MLSTPVVGLVAAFHLSEALVQRPAGVLRNTSPFWLERKDMAFIRAVVPASDAHMDLQKKLGRCCEPLQHRQLFVPAGDVVSSVLRR